MQSLCTMIRRLNLFQLKWKNFKKEHVIEVDHVKDYPQGQMKMPFATDEDDVDLDGGNKLN